MTIFINEKADIEVWTTVCRGLDLAAEIADAVAADAAGQLAETPQPSEHFKRFQRGRDHAATDIAYRIRMLKGHVQS